MLCPICNKQTIIHKKPIVYFQCSHCGHIYREPPVDPIEYHKKQYRETVRKNQDEFDENGVTPLFHSIRLASEKKKKLAIRSYLKPTDTILDIGSGAGTLASILKPLVARVDCLELDPILIAESRRLGFNTYEQDFLKQEFDGKYDIVMAWHVLEHVPDAKRFVSKMLCLSKRMVVIEVPHKRSYTKSYDNGHCHYFCDKSFRTLLPEFKIMAGIQDPALLAIGRNKK